MNKPVDSKLFKLKKWLTLPETAKHLSGICGEEVAIADILRLALDGHLILSVNFINHTHAKPGKVIEHENVVWKEMPSLIRNGQFSNIPLLIPDSLYIRDNKYLKLEKKVVVIKGVWDLPMIGNDRIDIEHKYQRLTDGPSVELINIDGTFVERQAGEIYQLQEYFGDRYGYEAATKAQFDKYIRLKFSKSNNRRKDKLLILREEKLEKLKEVEKEWKNYGRYYPAGGLPEDCVLVVRTDALREFEQFLKDNEIDTKTSSKPHGNTERFAKKREQVLGAALSVLARWPNECKNGLGKIEATKIRELIENKGYLFWRENGEPPLSTGEIEKLIREWLNKTND